MVNRLHNVGFTNIANRISEDADVEGLSQHAKNIRVLLNNAQELTQSTTMQASATRKSIRVAEETSKEIFKGPLDELIGKVIDKVGPDGVKTETMSTLRCINSVLQDLADIQQRLYLAGDAYADTAISLAADVTKTQDKIEKQINKLLKNSSALKEFKSNVFLANLRELGNELHKNLKEVPTEFDKFRVETLVMTAALELGQNIESVPAKVAEMIKNMESHFKFFVRDEIVGETRYREEILLYLGNIEKELGIDKSNVPDTVQRAMRDEPEVDDADLLDEAAGGEPLDELDELDGLDDFDDFSDDDVPLDLPEFNIPRPEVVPTPEPTLPEFTIPRPELVPTPEPTLPDPFSVKIPRAQVPQQEPEEAVDFVDAATSAKVQTRDIETQTPPPIVFTAVKTSSASPETVPDSALTKPVFAQIKPTSYLEIAEARTPDDSSRKRMPLSPVPANVNPVDGVDSQQGVVEEVITPPLETATKVGEYLKIANVRYGNDTSMTRMPRDPDAPPRGDSPEAAEDFTIDADPTDPELIKPVFAKPLLPGEPDPDRLSPTNIFLPKSARYATGSFLKVDNEVEKADATTSKTETKEAAETDKTAETTSEQQTEEKRRNSLPAATEQTEPEKGRRKSWPTVAPPPSDIRTPYLSRTAIKPEDKTVKKQSKDE